MHPIASERIQTGPNASKNFQKRAKTCKIARKLRDQGANFADVATYTEKNKEKAKSFRGGHERAPSLSLFLFLSLFLVCLQWIFGIISAQRNFCQTFQRAVSASFKISAGAILAVGLGTAARGPPPRRRRPHNSTFFEILNFGLRKFCSEISPNGTRTDTRWIPNGARTEPERKWP